jgi:hypothetical protein
MVFDMRGVCWRWECSGRRQEEKRREWLIWMWIAGVGEF